MTEALANKTAAGTLATTADARKGVSLIVKLAQKYGIEEGNFLNVVKQTLFPTDKPISNEQACAFLIVCNEYDLNPFIKEIYAFPGRNGGIVPIVSIDGWLTLINRRPELDGFEFYDQWEGKNLVAITCVITRTDRKHVIKVTEYLEECKRPTEPWKQWPARMLRHKALIQCARYAFGFAGVYDEDEGERIAETIQVSGRVTGTSANPATVTRAQLPASPEDAAKLAQIDRLAALLDWNQARKDFSIGECGGNLQQLIDNMSEMVKASQNGGEIVSDGEQQPAGDEQDQRAEPETQKEPEPKQATGKAANGKKAGGSGFKF